VFDVALEDVLPGVHAGACVVVPHLDMPTPAELVGVLAVRQVTRWCAPAKRLWLPPGGAA
jgi:hypothetical protein